MKIHIEKKIYIESDSYGYTIKEYTTRYDKKLNQDIEAGTILASYSTVRGCLHYLQRMKINESEATTIRELLEEQKRIDKWLEEKVTI